MYDTNKWHTCHPNGKFDLDYLADNEQEYRNFIYVYVAYAFNNKNAKIHQIQSILQQQYAALKICLFLIATYIKFPFYR